MKIIFAKIEVNHAEEDCDKMSKATQEEFSMSLSKIIDDTDSTADAVKELQAELHRRLVFINARKTN